MVKITQVADTEMNFQVFHPQNSTKTYKRLWHKFSSTWKPWSYDLVGIDVKGLAVAGFEMVVGGQQVFNLTVPGAVAGSRVIATPRVLPPQGIIVDFAIQANQMYVLKIKTDRETIVKQIVSSKK